MEQLKTILNLRAAKCVQQIAKTHFTCEKEGLHESLKGTAAKQPCRKIVMKIYEQNYYWNYTVKLHSFFPT